MPAYTLAVEQLMQQYYRTVMDVSLLNEMLLQLFREAILTAERAAACRSIARFQIRNDYLEAVSEEVFARYPSALLELFVLLQQHPELRGVRAETIRAVGPHLWLIDEEFRQNPRHHRLFLEILCAPVGVTHELRRMNTYGVLGRYIPAFGRVVGRMQYDLFHAYTVDAHTLFVVSNLRRFAIPKLQPRVPDASSQIMQSLPRQELAYLAALFHDIAKGRGGDHSELGAVDAEAFCLEQGLGRYEARLVAWLVRNHLILSITSQKKDISDPQIIHEFARRSAIRRTSTTCTCSPSRTCAAPTRSCGTPGRRRCSRSSTSAPSARCAAASRRPSIQRRPGARDPGRRARNCLLGHGIAEEAIVRAWSRFTAGATSCSIRPRRSPGTRACWPSATAASDEPLVALEPQERARHHRRAHLHAARAATALRAPRRCSTSWASTSSMRASPRPATASASICTTCSRTTAR